MQAGHGIALQVFDGAAIAEFLADRDLFWVAQQYLHIPSELMPPVPDSDAWYAGNLQRWKSREPIAVSSSDFQEIRLSLRQATRDGDTRSDLSFWIDLMRIFAGEPAPRQLRRAASYEIAVAALRGKGDMTPELALVRDFFADASDWLSVAELEDAATLVIYAFGARLLGQLNVEQTEVASWRKKIFGLLSKEIDSTNLPGRRSGLYKVRALLASVSEHADISPLDGAAFDDWEKMLDDAEKTPLFPIAEFADYLSKIAVTISGSSRYSAIAERVDDLLARRSGPSSAAEKIFERAVAFYEQDDLLVAIRDLHRVKLQSFTADTMIAFQRAAFLLANSYLELGLAYASKHVALAAAFIAKFADDPETAHTLPKFLFTAADADDGAGNSLSYIQMLALALGTHVKFDPDPLDFDKYFEIQKNLGQIAALRGIAARAQPELVSAIDNTLAEWPDQFRAGIEAASADPNAFWTRDTWESTWAGIQAAFIGRPFGDVGAYREAKWRALGVEWIVKFENRYEIVPIAEEFLSQLQIALVALADVDLVLVPTTITIDLDVATGARRPEIEEITTTQPTVGTRFAIKLAGAADPPDLQNGSVAEPLAVVAELVLACSLLLADDLMDPLKETLLKAASRIYIGRPYRELYREFVPEDIFGEERRRTLAPLAPNQAFPAREHELLAALFSEGPNYSHAESVARIRDRYESGLKNVRTTARRLAQDPEMGSVLQRWHDEGMKDWELLSIIANAAANIRYPLGDDEPDAETEGRFRAALSMPEDEENALFPAQISEELLLACKRAFHFMMVAGWKLDPTCAASDGRAIEALLIRRYRIREDDIPHEDLFGWNQT